MPAIPTMRSLAAALLRVAGTAIVAGAATCAAQAQLVSSRVAVAAGTATDERGVRSDASTVAPEATFALGNNAQMALSATGTRFALGSWLAGVSAALAARTAPAGPVALSLNGSAGTSWTSYGASFGVADVTPALELTTGPVTWFGGAHLASSRTTLRMTPSPLPFAAAGGADTSRSASGPVYGMQWMLSGAEAPVRISASFRGEQARIGDATIVDRTAGVQAYGGILTLGGSVGDRSSPAERTQFAALTLTANLMRHVSFEAAAGRYPSNPLTNAAGGRYVTAGLAFAFGGGADPRLPEPSGVEAPPAGRVRLAIAAPDARVVELYGDWNGWTGVRATRAPNGVWYVDVALDPGEYRYAFRVDGDAWRVPEHAVAATDEFGGQSAYVTVPRRLNPRGT